MKREATTTTGPDNKHRLTLTGGLMLLALVLFSSCVTQSSVSHPPESSGVLRDFNLMGELNEDQAAFTLTARAKVENPKGATIELLSGTLALTEVGPHPDWEVRAVDGRYVLVFRRSGEFPISVKFNAAVRQNEGWSSVFFRVAPSTLQPITLNGLAEDTQFQFAGAARPERKGEAYESFLPLDGTVNLAWKEARKTEEGRLFFAAEMLSQITVSPGLMRQVAVLDGKVMQGEMTRLQLLVRGEGEVIRVQGDQVLSWSVEPVMGSTDRQLTVHFNQPQKDHFSLVVQLQTPLGAFPQAADVMELQPEGAIRFAGYHRIVNDGAVRLEILNASGLSQVSPEQFPVTEATKALLGETGSQRFAYRFSGVGHTLRIQADQILPELSVSQVLVYQFGENEQAIDAELELDIREAPLRELQMRLPNGYAIARLNASGMSDYFITESDDEFQNDLRVVYGQPVSGRQVVQLRLERNAAMEDTNWTLPRVEVVKAKSVRGHIAITAEAGFRLTPGRTEALTEIATAFFPRKLAGIQSAFRLSDPAWSATMRIERLPQTVQADVFHLFSIGEGIAYGSSVMNYVVSGAPVSAFQVELSEEYFNVEFTGKDIRNWQKTTNGYNVQLHTPVSGAYTLLATYERPFNAQGEQLAFTGARPLDAQSEQGYTIVISAYQFQVSPTDVSPGLLALEPGEVPPEYRLFFDAPILAAYRYNTRPFDLRLALSPLEQGDSLSQVVDRAALRTHITKEGQVVTDVRYFVKSRGHSHFRMKLPVGTQLWTAKVNRADVVPVLDGDTNLIPLPQHADPNAVMMIDLKLATQSKDAGTIALASPEVGAPVMLAEWNLQPDEGRKLVYRKGSLTPAGGLQDASGFAGVAKLFSGFHARRVRSSLLTGLVMVGIALVAWRWAAGLGCFRFSARHLLGTLLGLLAFGIGIWCFAGIINLADSVNVEIPKDVMLLAPVQQAGSTLSVEVANVADEKSAVAVVASSWPAILTLGLWLFGWVAGEGFKRSLCWVLGWVCLGWAALRTPNGAAAFFGIIVVFLILSVAIPALRGLWQVPVRPELETDNTAPSVATLLLLGLFSLTSGLNALATEPIPSTNTAAVAESVIQEIRIEENYALATAKFHWKAAKGDTLPLLSEPAVLTSVNTFDGALRLTQDIIGGQRIQQLVAERSGEFAVEMRYQLHVTQGPKDNGFPLPTSHGLINQLKVTVVGLDVDVYSPEAVSVQRELEGTNTVATLVLSPASDAMIGWKPRSRDVRREKSVFYAELHQLYVPTAGVIEGAHYTIIRPAQGELRELTFGIPRGFTVTDVVDPANANPPLVSLWRFDPDARKLRVSLARAQSRPFALVVRSQLATGPLPFEHTVGLVSVEGAANQIGLLGIATGNEVQLDTVEAEALSAINLEDFPAMVAESLRGQIPGLTVRRALRYNNAISTATIKASPVEPDVRVETQDTLSLGEDRTVLASTATVDITRAGIFRLSFLLPEGLDVESISGAALSHWTELKTDAGRVITLHLRGKTVGQQQFSLSLSGTGLKASATNGSWSVPQLIVREASKQRGTLLIVPEQGMRLQVAARDGVTQLDPQKSGVKQKGVLAFRILQTPWNLALDIEQVDPWIQVTSLQHASVNEAQVKVTANLQYQIENTGLKAFRVLVPAGAEAVRFQGDQVSDYLALEGAVTNGLQEWEVRLHRRVIGQHLLQVSYQTPIADQSAETAVRGVQAADVNLQRGFVTVQSIGRLQVSVENPPVALQPTEWQSIPRALQQDLAAVSANFTYRLVEPEFELPLRLDRHEAAKLLPANVRNVVLTSVISDNGVMLTHVRMEMLPGDKRLLHLTLPAGGTFWFAFVNQNGVWPWREQDRILIPLEPQSREGKTVPVELFYTSKAGKAGGGSLNLQLAAPKFDLPLEDITWRVYLNEKWKLDEWAGTLQLQEQVLASSAAVDVQTYLQNEANVQQQKTREAEEMLAFGNTLLERGDPQQARRAFQSAYGLSQGDAAFNEDARVQLHNLKLQQALVGLNVRQAVAAGEEKSLTDNFRDLRGRKDLNYTQEDAKAILSRNNAEDNSAFMRLAQRLVQQQDAAVANPAAIQAAIPEQGRLLTFKRAVVVDRWADLNIGLEASAARAATTGGRFVILFATLLFFGLTAAVKNGMKKAE